MTKILVRERERIAKGEGLPRFAVVGVMGAELQLFQFHLRESELETIAAAIGAEIVMLPRGTGKDIGDGSGGGQRKRRVGGRRKTGDA